MYFIEEIYDELQRVNNLLSKNDLYLNLRVVGGAALIFNGITCVSTNDIDTCERIEYEVKDIIEECSVDINDDSSDYRDVFENCEFIKDNRRTFSNIDIEYLSLSGVIKSKLHNTNPEKLEGLITIFKHLKIKLTKTDIVKYLEDEYETVNDVVLNDIDNFIEYVNETE